MIAHFSIPARNPEAAVGVFARIIDGVVMPFPVVEGGWITLARDGSGVGVEVVPETTAIALGATEDEPSLYAAGLIAAPAPGAIHFAITSALSIDEIIALGEAQGWRAMHADRGPFDLVELWVDNRIMVEVLPPASTQRYLAFARPEVAAAQFAAATAA